MRDKACFYHQLIHASMQGPKEHWCRHRKSQNGGYCDPEGDCPLEVEDADRRHRLDEVQRARLFRPH